MERHESPHGTCVPILVGTGMSFLFDPVDDVDTRKYTRKYVAVTAVVSHEAYLEFEHETHERHTTWHTRKAKR